MWQGGDFPLEKIGTIQWGEGKKIREREKERKEKKEEERGNEKLYLISRFNGDRTVGFRWSKKQSSSTRRELHVGMRIWGFNQTPRGRGFSPNLVTFGLRAI